MIRRLASVAAAALLLLFALPPAMAENDVAIHEIQFTVDASGASRYEGKTVRTGGIVTALYPNGYTLQEPLSGPWSGILVSDPARRPLLGNFCVLTARVVEDDGMTILREISSFTIINSGNAVPPAVQARSPDIAGASPSAESLEGVLIKLGKSTVTGVPSTSAWEVADSTGVSARVGNIAGYAYRPEVGNNLAEISGVLFTSGGGYSLEPRNDADIIPINPYPSVTGQVSLQWRSDPAGVVVQLAGMPTAVTKSDGSYNIAEVPPGTYVIRAYAPGYLSAERGNVQVLPGHAITLPQVTLVGGDANGDGRIDLMDLTLVARSFGLCPPPDGWSDLTGDGCVNLMDLVMVSQNYNMVGPTPW